MFFFKKKKIVIDCFTDDSCAYNYHPIAKSTDVFPEWWRNLPSTYQQPVDNMLIDRATMKRCDGFIELFKNSVTLPAWVDIQIKTDNERSNAMFGKKHSNSLYPLADWHDKIQYGPEFNNKLHIKLFSPWYLKQSASCNFVMQPAVWHNTNNWTNFTILPGVVNFQYQHSTHVNLFLEKNKEKIYIEAGTPLYYIIPITDNQYEFKTHLVDTTEINKMYNNTYGSFTGSYKKIKRFMEEKTKKCPFNIK